MTPADSAAGISEPSPAALPRSRFPDRLCALFEVLVCSSFPTQLAIVALMSGLGAGPFDSDGRLSTGYVLGLALADSLLLTGLIFLFLHLHSESPRAIFLGPRPPGREAALGVMLIPAVIVVVLGVMLGLHRLAPWLHNVPRNPLEDLIDSGLEAGLFAIVAIVAGGVREEIQRAFILHRFDHHLGGAWVGLVLFSAVFGLGHAMQGWDAAITTGILGALWGLVYLRRQSIVAPVVSHAGFNTAEIVRHLLTGR